MNKITRYDTSEAYKLIDAICSLYNVRLEQLKSQSKTYELSCIKSAICIILREKGYRLVEIAEIIKTDHSGIVYHLKKKKDMEWSDKQRFEIYRLAKLKTQRL